MNHDELIAEIEEKIKELAPLLGGQFYSGTFRKALAALAAKEAKIAELEYQLQDWVDGHTKVVNDECAPDEKHCSCVPNLRKRIAELEARAHLAAVASDGWPDSPPCIECGAKTLQEAESICICSGDKDDCHGCHLWPDDEVAKGEEGEGGE